MIFNTTDTRLRTIVLEDEPENHEWLLSKLAQYPELELVGSAMTIDDAYRLIARQRPDAAFMDIELIGGTGFQLLERLRQQGLPLPFIVITTGFPDYIWTTFNDYRYAVVQYLTKPFVEDWPQTFRKAIDALLAANLQDVPAQTTLVAPPITIQSSPLSEHQIISVNHRGNLLRIDTDKICFLEAAGGGEIFLVTDSETLQLDYTLSKFMELLPSKCFVRVSRSNVVNFSKILRVSREDRTLEVAVDPVKRKILGIGEIFYSDLVKLLTNSKPIVHC